MATRLQFIASAATAVALVGTAVGIDIQGNKAPPLQKEVGFHNPHPCDLLNRTDIVIAFQRLSAREAPSIIYCTRNGGRVRLERATYMNQYAK